MNALQTYKKWRWRYRKLKHIVFMSPAEVRFVELMGGKVYTNNRLKVNGFPFAIVISMGKILRREHFKREVRYGKYFVDFSNDLNRIIEIDGSQYHRDVVADMDREIYIKEMCRRIDRNREARIMRIPAFRLGLDPQRVQQNTIEFIKNGKY
jgi:very-short-patch-repair endonuclease